MSNATEARRQVFDTLNKYKTIIIIAIPAIIGIVVGISFFKTSTNNKEKLAWAKLWNTSRNQMNITGSTPEEEAESRSKAIKEYNSIINDMEAENVSSWALYQLGNTHFDSKNYDEAITIFEQFLKGDNDHYFAPFVIQSIGYAYEQKGQFQKAIDYYNKINLDILIPQKNLDIGRCYENLGLTEPAIDAYNKVIELEEKDNNWVRIAQYRIDALK